MMPSLVELSKRSVQLTDAERKARRERTQARVGLASNVVGLTAATAATNTAARDFVNARRAARGLAPKAAKEGGRLAQALGRVKAKHAVGLAGAGLILQGSNTAGDVVANRVLARSAKEPTSKGMSMESISDVYESEGHGDGRGHSLSAVAKGMALTPQQMLGTALVPEEISKRARRYDPEADRQRRMGLYAGAGVGTSAALASQAAPRLAGLYDREKRTLKIPKLKGKSRGRTGLGLAALSAASGAGGVAAYRHGISRRNQPYN